TRQPASCSTPSGPGKPKSSSSTSDSVPTASRSSSLCASPPPHSRSRASCRGREASSAAASSEAAASCAALAVGLGHEPHGGRVALQVPPAPPGKVYEIWLVRDGRAVAAGFAHAGRNEIRHVPRGSAVAVTLEPRGGSRRPTGPLLLRAETA